MSFLSPSKQRGHPYAGQGWGQESKTTAWYHKESTVTGVFSQAENPSESIHLNVFDTSGNSGCFVLITVSVLLILHVALQKIFRSSFSSYCIQLLLYHGVKELNYSNKGNLPITHLSSFYETDNLENVSFFVFPLQGVQLCIWCHLLAINR